MDQQLNCDVLPAIQQQLHNTILSRCAGVLKDNKDFEMPQLTTTAPGVGERNAVWCGVPGMYGGFNYWWADESKTTLVAESWCRVVGGSGQRHEITTTGFKLVDEGFV
eukprot:TRINITY_DN14125_c0_g1_i1.p1 TRINITY_DN14125_c0_g1~~TRINITY_DN14125_c0_g1_i1.p1  ORF type:complete len:108 (-),score=17.28 TRINITY_DN14125_c0_g1_i1:116-439(-)